MNFGEALEELKKGKRIAREGWGGYWELQNARDVLGEEALEGDSFILAYLKDGGVAAAQAYQADMLAEDWELVRDTPRKDTKSYNKE